MTEPILLATDRHSPGSCAGEHIFDMPGHFACAQMGGKIKVLSGADLIPLPAGSNMFLLPDRSPIAFNARTQNFEVLDDHGAVAAFIPPGYTQLFTVPYKERKGAGLLPLFSYAPVAFYKGKVHVAALRVDRRKNHDISGLDAKLLTRRISVFKGSRNRLIQHLALCAQTNHCPNAVNFFLGKYEAPLPTSPLCNARCLGCISAQPKGSCQATQDRLTFKPTADEIAEVALAHIKNAHEPVVSFGQGCEGEPLLAARVIQEAIKMIRRETARGTIHMNTNASLTSQVDALCASGLDSIRVSLNSARKECYARYYAPRGYTFADVVASISAAKRRGKFVALNYLVMPGFTDREDEFEALCTLIRQRGVDMIQWRNLNYDPQRYFKRMNVVHDVPLLGMRTIMQKLRKEFPKLRHGYFNLPKEKM